MICFNLYILTTSTNISFPWRCISLLFFKSICRNVDNVPPCAHMWCKTQQKQQPSVVSRSHRNSEALQGTNLRTLAKFPSHACCNYNLRRSHCVVTDRTLLHAGLLGEIPQVLLAFPDNSISSATGSQCISRLGLPFRTQLKVSDNSGSPLLGKSNSITPPSRM